MQRSPLPAGAVFLWAVSFLWGAGLVAAPDDRLQAFKNAAAPPSPLSAVESLERIRVRDGFVVELMASEPLVLDPIALEWGPDGKLWVVEMADYPLGLDDRGEPGGRVRFLEDTDGDGRYDRSTVFVDKLGFPTNAAPWRDGVLITAAPAIYYAEDTDGDGKADRRETLYEGFFEGNQQHRVNSLRWGLDGWIHVANGDSGGTVRSVKSGLELDIRGRDLRILPDTGELELETGQTQYGRRRDDWGNWFGCSNPHPVFHFALTERYLRRNPHFAPPRGTVYLAQGDAKRLFPISRVISHWSGYKPPKEDEQHFPTSMCGITVYRDEVFGAGFEASTFTSDPIHNLVHRRQLRPHGVEFESVRADDEQGVEFLASIDSWFRPTTLRTGPDGALWIADMYRLVLEHPQWIDDVVEKTLDLRAGHDRGRIYRVYPKGATLRPLPSEAGGGLVDLPTAELVKRLDSPGGWQRDTAHQLLSWRADPASVPPLQKLTRSSASAKVRLQALCAVDTVGGLDVELLRDALLDKHAAVRRHAVRLVEGRLGADTASILGPAVLGLFDDPDPTVRLQLAYSLGAWDDPRAGDALVRLAWKDASDKFQVAAAMSSLGEHNVAAVAKTFFSLHGRTPATGVRREALYPTLLESIAALGGPADRARVLDLVSVRDGDGYASWKLEVLAGICDGLERRGESLAPLNEAVVQLFAYARSLAESGEAEDAERSAAVNLLGRQPQRRQDDIRTLAALLRPAVVGAVQVSAAQRLADMNDPDVPGVLVEGWSGREPRVRRAVLDGLLSREAWHGALLGFLEDGSLPVTDIDAARRQRLLAHDDIAVRGRAAKALGVAVGEDRGAVVEAHRDALELKGSRARGQSLFAQRCAVCHVAGGMGHRVGPDIVSIKDRSPASLLVAILDPNRAVEDNFRGYVAVTRSGAQIVTGILRGETGASVRLLGQEGQEKVILRSDLEALRATGMSLMPEGLEKDLSRQELADVIAFVAAAEEPPKRVPGNQPVLVEPTADGVLDLTAASAEIYGDRIAVYETQRCIGWWMHPDDHLVWSLEVPRASRYEVWLEWAIPERFAGNRFVAETTHGKTLSGTVPSTGSFKTFREQSFGEIELAAGYERLTLRAEGTIRGELADLRRVKLVPVAPPAR